MSAEVTARNRAEIDAIRRRLIPSVPKKKRPAHAPRSTVAEVAEHYHSTLRHRAALRGVGYNDAADIVQEALVIALSKYDPKRCPSPYSFVVGCVDRLCANFIRKRSTHISSIRRRRATTRWIVTPAPRSTENNRRQSRTMRTPTPFAAADSSIHRVARGARRPFDVGHPIARAVFLVGIGVTYGTALLCLLALALLPW